MTFSVSESFKLLFIILFVYILPIHQVTPHGYRHRMPALSFYITVTSNAVKNEVNHSAQSKNEVQPLKPPQCGYVIKPYRTRVVGGYPAEVGAWPWIANIGYGLNESNAPDFKCGGSLISSRHVLTAGHCIYGYNNSFFIRLGEHDLRRDDDGAIDVPVKKVTIHPNYNNASYQNDIAILELANEVKFTDAIHPICLPVQNEIKNHNFTNNYLFVAGWGSTSTAGPFSDILLETQVPVVEPKVCANAYRYYKNLVVDDRVICAGYFEGGKDSCEGDSGGPLIFPKNQIYYLIGVVSGGSERCAEPGMPGLYTRVTRFLDFILSNMN